MLDPSCCRSRAASDTAIATVRHRPFRLVLFKQSLHHVELASPRGRPNDTSKRAGDAAEHVLYGCIRCRRGDAEAVAVLYHI